MKKLYQKDEIWFAVLWIVLYVVLFQNADNISNSISKSISSLVSSVLTLIGALAFPKLITAPVALILSAVLYGFIRKNGLTAYYGLCPFKGNRKAYLYFLPLVVLCSTNLWRGVTMNLTIASSILHIISMCCVGFLEEVIFRGLLFEAMRKDNVKVAIIVSSVTFGIGHIINLINGSGAELLPNLLQVVYATAAGFMFVMMYYKSKSMIVCIVAHGVFNALSVFANEANATAEMRILTAILLTVITGSYALYLALSMKGKTND